MTSDRILAGKHVLITGAGRGLGEAYARAAAAEGARVVVSDINAESAEAVAESINREGGEAFSRRGGRHRLGQLPAAGLCCGGTLREA